MIVDALVSACPACMDGWWTAMHPGLNLTSFTAMPYAGPSPPPSPLPIGLTTGPGYLGCFVDNTTDGMRALNDFWGKDPSMTIEMCRDLATSQYLRYYGVQYSVECYATNDATSPFMYGPAPSINCTMACAGNTTEQCGGDAVNDVYDAGASFQECWCSCVGCKHAVVRLNWPCICSTIPKVAEHARCAQRQR
jgi:hypothetical protein